MLQTEVAAQAWAFPSELGWMLLVWSGDRLQRFAMGHPSLSAALAAHEADGEHAEPTDDPPAAIHALAERLQAYASGADDTFRDVPLELGHLTDFQRRVVQHCRRIGRGKTLSYGELATRAGSPGAARAVGNVMAKNRFPIIVPCHRVVGSTGALHGFSAPRGISLKQQMLEREGCKLKARA
jgi:methylated-DNA-[protein]-cysteine S-methyltransferase